MSQSVTVKRQGRNLVPHGPTQEAILARYPEGELLHVEIVQAQSQKHRSLTFALISQAFSNWPEQYQEFQPEDARHLRQWLLAKAGWCTYVDVEPMGAPDACAQWAVDLMKRTRIDGDWRFPKPVKIKGVPMLRIFVPKPFDEGALDQDDLNEVTGKMFAKLEDILGLSVEEQKQMLRRKKEAAADPTVRNVLDAFPASELVDVRDLPAS